MIGTVLLRLALAAVFGILLAVAPRAQITTTFAGGAPGGVPVLLEVTVWLDTENGCNCWTSKSLGVFKSIHALFQETSWNGTGMSGNGTNWYTTAPNFNTLNSTEGVKLRIYSLPSNNARQVWADSAPSGATQVQTSGSVNAWLWPRITADATHYPEIIGPVAWVDWATQDATWYNRPMRGLWRRSAVIGVNGSDNWVIAQRMQRVKITGWNFFITRFIYCGQCLAGLGFGFTATANNNFTTGGQTIWTNNIHNVSTSAAVGGIGAYEFTNQTNGGTCVAGVGNINAMTTVFSNNVLYNVAYTAGAHAPLLGSHYSNQASGCWANHLVTQTSLVWSGTPATQSTYALKCTNSYFGADTVTNSGAVRTINYSAAQGDLLATGSTGCASNDASAPAAALRSVCIQSTAGGCSRGFDSGTWDGTFGIDNAGNVELIPNAAGALFGAATAACAGADNGNITTDLLGLTRTGTCAGGHATIGAIDNNAIPADGTLADIITAVTASRTTNKVAYYGRAVAGSRAPTTAANPAIAGVTLSTTLGIGDTVMISTFDNGEFQFVGTPDGRFFGPGGGHSGWVWNDQILFNPTTRDWSLAYTGNHPTDGGGFPAYALNVYPALHPYYQTPCYDPISGTVGFNGNSPWTGTTYGGGPGMAGFYTFDSTMAQEVGSPVNFTVTVGTTALSGDTFHCVNNTANRISYAIWMNAGNRFNIQKVDWANAVAARLSNVWAGSLTTQFNEELNRMVFVPAASYGNTNGAIFILGRDTTPTLKAYRIDLDSPALTDVTSQLTSLPSAAQGAGLVYRAFDDTLVVIKGTGITSWPAACIKAGGSCTPTTTTFDAASDAPLASLGTFPSNNQTCLGTAVADNDNDVIYVGCNTVNGPLLWAPAQ